MIEENSSENLAVELNQENSAASTSTSQLQVNQNLCQTETVPAAESEAKAFEPVTKDPADWVINDTTIEQLLLTNIDQNLDADFSVTATYCPISKKNRHLTKNVFQRKLKNGEVQVRKYLIYSPKKKMFVLYTMPIIRWHWH